MGLGFSLAMLGLLLGALAGNELYWYLVRYAPSIVDPPLYHFLTDPSCEYCIKHVGPNSFWVAIFVLGGAFAGALGLGLVGRLLGKVS